MDNRALYVALIMISGFLVFASLTIYYKWKYGRVQQVTVSEEIL